MDAALESGEVVDGECIFTTFRGGPDVTTRGFFLLIRFNVGFVFEFDVEVDVGGGGGGRDEEEEVVLDTAVLAVALILASPFVLAASSTKAAEVLMRYWLFPSAANAQRN